MPKKDTHCDARLLRGDTWLTAEPTGSFSGPPDGVLLMLFSSFILRDPGAAKQVLETLNQDFAAAGLN